MAVAALVENRRFALLEQDPGDPPAGHVQVRVESVGICGSDLHWFQDGAIGETQSAYPQVLGHEPAGRILKLGEGVTGWAVGDRAALEPPLYCYHCEMCMSGRHNLCFHGDFMSSPTAPGYFRDRANIPAANLLPLPSNIGYDEATLYEPISIVLHSFRFADPKLGEDVVVFGAGPIGLSTIACLKLAGVRRIWAVERGIPAGTGVATRRRCRHRSACHRPCRRDPQGYRPWRPSGDRLRHQGGHHQPVAARREAGRPGLHHWRAAGLRVPFEFHTMRSKELAFFTIRRSNHVSDKAIDLLAAEARRFTPMLSHRMPMDRIQSAFETLEAYRDGANKIVLHP